MSKAVRVLVVEDEPPLADLVSRYLLREGYEVLLAADGESALTQARERAPDIVVLDLMLPGIDGLEVTRQLRTFSDAYVIMLTARAEEVDRVVGLTVGADDYITKPFSPRELVARIQAMLRRPRAAPLKSPAQRRFGPLSIDADAREVHLNGELIDLTKLEFDLLDALSSEPRVVFSKERLLDSVWGSASYRDAHVVAVHIANLRNKLGDDPAEPQYILTIRGVGYRMGSP